MATKQTTSTVIAEMRAEQRRQDALQREYEREHAPHTPVVMDAPVPALAHTLAAAAIAAVNAQNPTSALVAKQVDPTVARRVRTEWREFDSAPRQVTTKQAIIVFDDAFDGDKRAIREAQEDAETEAALDQSGLPYAVDILGAPPIPPAIQTWHAEYYTLSDGRGNCDVCGATRQDALAELRKRYDFDCLITLYQTSA